MQCLLHGGQPRRIAALRRQSGDPRLDDAAHLIRLAQPLKARSRGIAVDALHRFAVHRLGARDLALLGEDQTCCRQLAQRLAGDRL